MKRVVSLDYLRGIMACSVMLYHYLSWSIFEPSLGGEYVLGKLGIYAVSIFYILSGLSLSIVYDGRIKKRFDVESFYIKRIFRIFPLYWLAISTAIAYKLASQIINGESLTLPFSINSIVLNYSLTFGFFDHDNYLTTGAWSIGNEIVFYSILPVIFILSNRSKFFIPLIFSISLAMGIYFAFHLLNPSLSLPYEQWSYYINPLNQFFLFMGGVVIGKYGHLIKNKALVVVMLFSAIILFTFYPASGDKIGIVTGLSRLFLSFSCFAIVFGVYLINPVFKGVLSKFFSFLGESCYSIYLLHPLVAFPVVYLGGKLGVDKIILYLFCIPLTFIVSWISFRYIEEPSMRIGKKLVALLKERRESPLLTQKRSN